MEAKRVERAQSGPALRRPVKARDAKARSGDLIWREAGRRQSCMGRGDDCPRQPLVPNSLGVARAANPKAERAPDLIRDERMGLGAADIQAEKVTRHFRVLRPEIQRLRIPGAALGELVEVVGVAFGEHGHLPGGGMAG